MRLGVMIANVFTALLLVSILVLVFWLAGKPLFAHREAKMVILLPPDAVTTGSLRAPAHLQLPDTLDLRLVQPRPGQD
jgi:hypothetical protein